MTRREIEEQLSEAQEFILISNFKDADRICTEALYSPIVGEEPSLRARALRLLADSLHRQGRASEALPLAVDALEIAEKAEDKQEAARALYIVGSVHTSMGAYAQALEDYSKSFTMHEELGNRTERARVTGNTGLVYWNLGDYARALEYYARALAEFEALDNKAIAAVVTGNIGLVHNDMGDYAQALEYYRKALAVHEHVGNKAAAATITGNIGLAYSWIGDRTKALEYYGKALAASKELGMEAEAARVTGNIGSEYESMGDYTQALEYYSQALSSLEELGNNASAAITISNIGYIYSMKGFVGHDAAKAEEMLLKAIATNEELGAKRQLYLSHKYLAELYKGEQRWKECQMHFEKYHELKDEVQSDEAKKKAEQILQQKQVAEREKRLALAKERENILNNILPEEITARLIRGENPIADHFDSVSVLFMDIVDFTVLSRMISAQQLVHLLNAIFSSADAVMREYGLEKIKTIGDAYMAVAGAPVVQDDHSIRAAQAALKLIDVMKNLVVSFPDEYGDRSWIESIPEIQVRIGLHCGPVAAGVVGENKFSYDLWGDTVNTASRMESHGDAGRIHVSEEFRTAIFKSDFLFVDRGAIDIKGKGTMRTYYLEKA